MLASWRSISEPVELVNLTKTVAWEPWTRTKYTYDAAGDRVRKDLSNTWTEYVSFGGALLSEKHPDGHWTDFIYANGQRIAADATGETRIHFSGTNATAGLYSMYYVPLSGNIPVQSGAKLVWRQYQHGAANPQGGIGVVTTSGTNMNWWATDQDGQVINSDTTEDSWHSRIVDLTPIAGQTISTLWLNEDTNTGAGSWDEYFADIAIVQPDGTVTTLYDITGQAYSGYSPSGVNSPSFVVETPSWTVANPNLTVRYYLEDHLGTARMEFAPEGWPVWTGDTAPFGQEFYPQYTPNHYKFTGQERDSETTDGSGSGNDYFHARYYNSYVGRFTSPDPYDGSMDLENPQSLNRYAYVINNPLGATDPSGLFGEDITTFYAYAFAGGGTAPILDIVLTSLLGLADLGEFFFGGLFDHPQLQGTTHPRPEAQKGCPPVPPHPPGSSINANIDSVQPSVLSNSNWFDRARQWTWKVHNYNAPWSYQRIGEQSGVGNLYDDFGNFNYGATGTALGFRDVTLLFGAGVAKWGNYARDHPPQINPYWNKPWMNDPHKVDMIKQGIRYVKNGCKNE